VTAWVLHVDLDQFIAAVEVLRRPELRGKPVVVGGDGDPTKRGVVATASYEAREFGVHSGLPLRTAARRCPDCVFLPSDRAVYEAASDEVMTALRGLGAVTEVMGWDEAFVAADTDDPEGFARDVQRTIRAATQLDSTVGIGENRLQAKLATGFGKPRRDDPARRGAADRPGTSTPPGAFRLTHANWFAVMGGEPVSALWGVGAKTAAKLAELGIATVSDLAAADIAVMARRFGPTIGPWLVATARGLDSSHVSGKPYLPRSRGREVTFQQDIDDWERVRSEVAHLAGLITEDVAAEGRPAVRVVVKVRYRPFFTATHGVPLGSPTADVAEIEQAALDALERFTDRRPVRLLGVRAEFAAEPET
jgi:nucleotidyltransferase/DNA polymerase involved in DNA repair